MAITVESKNFMDGEVNKFGDLQPPGFFANLMSGTTSQTPNHTYSDTL